MLKYHYLKPGEKIQKGDQYQRPDGKWVDLDEKLIEKYQKMFPEILIYKGSELPCRRLIKE